MRPAACLQLAGPVAEGRTPAAGLHGSASWLCCCLVRLPCLAGEEAEAAGDGAAAAPAAAEQLAGEAEGAQQQQRGKLDLDSIVDLSSLDLSILEQPARMPPLARVSDARRGGGRDAAGGRQWQGGRLSGEAAGSRQALSTVCARC